MRKFIFILLFVSAFPASAARALPEGVYTTLDSYSPPIIRLDGKEFQTSAAFQIRDTQNRLIAPQRVPTDVPVWIQVEPSRQDLVWRAWILSPDEVAYLKSIGRINELQLTAKHLLVGIAPDVSSGAWPCVSAGTLGWKESRRVWNLALEAGEDSSSLAQRFRVNLEEAREAVRVPATARQVAIDTVRPRRQSREPAPANRR